jgi:hypothetical protein
MAQPDAKEAQVDVAALNDVKIDGSLEFVQEVGGNESKPSYQEASGALVKNISPLGMLQTDPAGRVVGLRVPAPWVGS